MSVPISYLLAGVFVGVGLGSLSLFLLVRWLAGPGIQLTKAGGIQNHATMLLFGIALFGGDLIHYLIESRINIATHLAREWVEL